jgi:hypothetical protein
VIAIPPGPTTVLPPLAEGPSLPDEPMWPSVAAPELAFASRSLDNTTSEPEASDKPTGMAVGRSLRRLQPATMTIIPKIVPTDPDFMFDSSAGARRRRRYFDRQDQTVTPVLCKEPSEKRLVTS